MKLDRLVLDILDWVRRLIWNREGEVKQKPYEKIKTWRGTLGILNQVHRDTPRAIATYMFMPFRHGKSKDSMIDTHLFLDTLAPVQADAQSRRKSTSKFSHRVTIIQASHWVKTDLSYNAETLYMGDWDFQGRSQFLHRYATAIIQSVAKVLMNRTVEEINWEREIIDAGKGMIGHQWNPVYQTQTNTKPNPLFRESTSGSGLTTSTQLQASETANKSTSTSAAKTQQLDNNPPRTPSNGSRQPSSPSSSRQPKGKQ